MRILTYTLTLLVCLAGSRLAAEGNDHEILEQDNKEAPFEKPAKGAERPFFMGFSNIPPAISIDGIAAYVKFLDKHSDIVCLNFDGGVPWVEALKGKDFSMSLMDDWKGNRDVVPKGNTILLSLTPLDFSHVKLAKYYGEKKDLELPPQWSNKTLDNADVKKAYLNYVKAAVKFFNPKYVSIGQNVNEALTASPAAWRDYKDLHKHIYAELKKEHPKLRVFATV
ncbi:MAG: hypothetical protein HY770_08305, partial [Chitinivibrionia bacterium]|nr:hypothetical protein [Chitinivibrionia bacterium]